uniref:Ig-like domain-containing protein n=1 Tax=Plectus sambesii TaxID=2011161 RepID=A0A914X395_9BILA
MASVQLLKAALLLLLASAVTDASLFGNGSPPRFRQNVRTMEEVFLGDSTRLKCAALGRPAPHVHWYRNDKYLDYKASNNFRIKENQMTLEIRRVEVSDQGSWACKVWNNEGHIWRNFTLEIIDFCDYYLPEQFPASNVPERCICQWYMTPRQERRRGINWDKVDLNRCQQYRAQMDRQRRPPISFSPCILPPCMSDTNENAVRDMPPDDDEDDDDEDDASDEDLKRPQANSILGLPVADDPRVGILPNPSPLVDVAPSSSTSTSTTTSTTTTSAPATRQPGALSPLFVAPYFKVSDAKAQLTIVSPAGRTVKLACKVGGRPAPQVAWMKDGKVLTTLTVRSVGGSYKIRSWTLEIEDANTADSGKYTCEAFNVNNPSFDISRTFSVEIIERLRSKPIIVPNVLVNQTVDANTTANFTCRVISDLTPHIIWIRVLEKNGSFHYWNHTSRQHEMNFTDMSTIETAEIIKHSDSSTLRINNVTKKDEGIYACVTGNSLGSTQAMAMLKVNEFY